MGKCRLNPAHSLFHQYALIPAKPVSDKNIRLKGALFFSCFLFSKSNYSVRVFRECVFSVLSGKDRLRRLKYYIILILIRIKLCKFTVANRLNLHFGFVTEIINIQYSFPRLVTQVNNIESHFCFRIIDFSCNIKGLITGGSCDNIRFPRLYHHFINMC